jgi:cytochrome c oxidase subunit 2
MRADATKSRSIRGLTVRAIVAAVLLASAAPAATAATLPDSGPQELIHSLSMLLLAVCTAVFVVVAGLLAYGLYKYRSRAGDALEEPPQVYGSGEIELAWTVIPILLVFIFFLATARTLNAIQNEAPSPEAIQATVVGHQWWWEIRYPQLGFTTANEMLIPVSDPTHRTPTFLTLESADVAHSFWVPELAGKTDVIPNHTNQMWLEPRKPGVYLGNCAEFCGLQHANMLIRVVVESPEEFAAWVEAQRRDAAAAPEQQAGRDLFLKTSCVNCHTVRGTRAAGTFGPDLTHFASRQTLGSGVAPNDHDKLRAWMRNPQRLKPGCNMPDMQLTDAEVDEIVAYLATLQ